MDGILIEETDKCPHCNKPYAGFRDPLSISIYRETLMCQACQDEIFGTDYQQVCETCGKVIPKGEEIIVSNYAVCSKECQYKLVGLEGYL